MFSFKNNLPYLLHFLSVPHQMQVYLSGILMTLNKSNTAKTVELLKTKINAKINTHTKLILHSHYPILLSSCAFFFFLIKEVKHGVICK